MRVHPLLRRELNLRMREWNAFWLPLLYCGSLCATFGAIYASQRAFDAPWQIGATLFSVLSVASLALLALAVPVFAAGSLTAEREQRTLEPLLLTCLSPRDIVQGKLLAAVAYGLLLLSTSLPVIALTAAFGGVSLSVMAMHFLSLGSTAVALAAFGVFVSSWFQRSVYAIALCYGAMALLFALALFLVAMLTQVGEVMQLPLSHWVAFLNPLYFLDEDSRGQWPLALFWSMTLTYIFRAAAVARLASEERERP